MPGPFHWKKRHQGYFCRWTSPRKSILDLLDRTHHHMSANEIHSALYGCDSGTGLTTIYRTLDLLVQKGLILKHTFRDGLFRYELISKKQKEHHHLICEECGKIIDYIDFKEEELSLIQKTEKNWQKNINSLSRITPLNSMGSVKTVNRLRNQMNLNYSRVKSAADAGHRHVHLLG